jgi:hypothetical protein
MQKPVYNRAAYIGKIKPFIGKNIGIFSANKQLSTKHN